MSARLDARRAQAPFGRRGSHAAASSRAPAPGRDLQPRPARGHARRGRRAGHQRRPSQGARRLDRDRHRRHRHGLYRQVRIRPGPLHRADAADRRRGRRAARPRAPDSMRHVDDARSGHDVGRAVAPGELQSRQPCARRRDRARSARAAGLAATRRAAPSSSSPPTAPSRSGATRRSASPTARWSADGSSISR